MVPTRRYGAHHGQRRSRSASWRCRRSRRRSSVALRELGPTLTWFGLGLLGLGATLTALFVFRPAHKRLRALEEAARALGEGRTDVRATEAGGDEVSSLARTFNRMADRSRQRARPRSSRPIARGASCSPTSRTS